MRHIALLLLLLTSVLSRANAVDAEQLYYTLRTKVLSVRDYTADVKMKVDITYMKIPKLEGKLYFKAPDKLRMERKGGISILPKKNINLTLNNLIPTGKVTVIDGGEGELNGKKVRILKVIPEEEQIGIVLAKLWVDEANVVALRTETTTLNEGTVTMDLVYGRYINNALPDKMTITMDVKNYKIPKGITMDYSEVQQTPAKTAKGKTKKGVIEITYLNYVINKGIDNAVFSSTEE